MSKRRSQGEGSIHQESNGRWVARIEAPRSPDGRRRRVLRRAATKRQALDLLTEMRQYLSSTGQLPNRTLQETIDEYVTALRADEKIAVKTRNRDQRWAKRITEIYGDTKTKDLTVQMCDLLLQQIADGTLPGGTGESVGRDYVRRARSFLVNALNNDLRLGLLSVNVASLALVPATAGRTHSRRSLTNAEWRQLFNGSTGLAKLSIDLGGRHGLRPQEVRSLQWEGIDLRVATLTVLNQFDSTDEFVNPKTRNSSRTIRLHPETVVLLNQRLDQLREVKQRSPTQWTERDLVISTRYGTAINKNNHRRSIHSACDKSQIGRVTPYELRHTAITHQIDAGHSISQVADWAGTSEKMIYKHYRHKIREVVSLDPVDHQNDDQSPP